MKKFLFAAAVACTAFCLGCASGERVESKGATTTTKAGCSGEAAGLWLLSGGWRSVPATSTPVERFGNWVRRA